MRPVLIRLLLFSNFFIWLRILYSPASHLQDYILVLDMVSHALGKWRQEDLGYKVITSDVVSSRAAWVTLNTSSTNQLSSPNNNNKKTIPLTGFFFTNSSILNQGRSITAFAFIFCHGNSFTEALN